MVRANNLVAEFFVSSKNGINPTKCNVSNYRRNKRISNEKIFQELDFGSL